MKNWQLIFTGHTKIIFDKRTAFPKFKNKAQGDILYFSQWFQIDAANNRIKLSKLGWACYRNSREIFGKPKNITLSQKNRNWFAGIQTEREVEPPIPTAMGIDIGICAFGNF